jgi:hypothetical protein
MDIKKITKIFIIESPSIEDKRIQRKEGLALSEILKLSDIQNTYSTVDSISDFRQTLIAISSEVKRDIKKFGAITIHFSMHGTQEGLKFTNSDFLNWEELYFLVKEFNDILGYLQLPSGRLFAPININLSVCEGFYATELKKFGTESQYQSLIGPIVKVNWADSILAFATYYHNTLHHKNGSKIAVEKMNIINDFDNIFRIDLMDGIELK